MLLLCFVTGVMSSFRLSSVYDCGLLDSLLNVDQELGHFLKAIFEENFDLCEKTKIELEVDGGDIVVMLRCEEHNNYLTLKIDLDEN